jgi:hypothetical protein
MNWLLIDWIKQHIGLGDCDRDRAFIYFTKLINEGVDVRNQIFVVRRDHQGFLTGIARTDLADAPQYMTELFH